MAAALVAASHAGALYVLAHEIEPVLPSVSVPLMISLATASEPAQVKPKPKPKPKPTPPRQAPKPPTPVAKPDPVPAAVAPKPPAPPEEPAPRQEEPIPLQAEAPPPAPVAPAPPQVIPPRFDAAYLDNPVPAYPPLSRRLGEQGRVMLRVYVNPDGTTGEVQVRDSSGSPRLDHAAKAAVQRWKFTPARRGVESIGAWVVVPIKFSLSNRG